MNRTNQKARKKRYDPLTLERKRRNQLKSFTTPILERAVQRDFPRGGNRLRRDNFFLHQGIREPTLKA